MVGTGTALGGLTRFVLHAALGSAGLLPLLLVNVVGSVAMGAFKPGPFWGTGFLGGFTTFAAFAFITSEQEPLTAALYVAAALVMCVGGYLAGDALHERRTRA